MNFVNSLCLLVVFSAAVLVIVNGQPTTDDDSGKDEINILINRIIKLERTVAELKGQLAATSTRKPDECTFSYLCVLRRV